MPAKGHAPSLCVLECVGVCVAVFLSLRISDVTRIVK